MCFHICFSECLSLSGRHPSHDVIFLAKQTLIKIRPYSDMITLPLPTPQNLQNYSKHWLKHMIYQKESWFKHMIYHPFYNLSSLSSSFPSSVALVFLLFFFFCFLFFLLFLFFFMLCVSLSCFASFTLKQKGKFWKCGASRNMVLARRQRTSKLQICLIR